MGHTHYLNAEWSETTEHQKAGAHPARVCNLSCVYIGARRMRNVMRCKNIISVTRSNQFGQFATFEKKPKMNTRTKISTFGQTAEFIYSSTRNNAKQLWAANFRWGLNVPTLANFLSSHPVALITGLV